MAKYDFNIHNWRGRYLNESVETDVNKLYKEVTFLSAEEMERFFGMLAKYFHDNAEELTNMDSIAIGDHLVEVYNEIVNRTGN